MSDQPLYFKNNLSKIVHPAKILPSLLEKQKEKKKANQSMMTDQNILTQAPLEKEKKIKKQDIRKHYRTKMCPYGRQCKKRFTCTFAHTEQQLRKPFIKRKNPCLLYQRGQCSLGSACKDYHGNIDLQKNYKYKQKICQSYIQGKCEKGNICIFLHQDPKAQQIQAQINNQLQQNMQQQIEQENDFKQQQQIPQQNEKKQEQTPKQHKQQQQIDCPIILQF